MADFKDPLSLLAGNDSSSSDSEEEEMYSGKGLTDTSYYTPTTSNDSTKLPSPSTLFATVSQPKFLTTHIDPHHTVNWDKLVKSAEVTPPIDHTQSGKYSAIPPPKELNEDPKLPKSTEISSAPVIYSQQQDDNQDSSVAGNKRQANTSQDSEGEESESNDTLNAGTVKKPKVETFREKEKRKRDLGMTSRGKNFVEEEKRILREQFSTT